MFKELFEQPFQVIILVLGFIILLGSIFSIEDIRILAISTKQEPNYIALLVGLGLILSAIVLHLSKKKSFQIILGIFIVIVFAIVTIKIDYFIKFSDNSKRNSDLFLLIGSGTVHSYLKHFTPSLIIRNNENQFKRNMHVLEGGSETAISVMSTAYRHGREIEGKSNIGIPILAMASDQMSIKDFEGDQDKKGKFFEVIVGIDTLKITFASKSESDFKKAFLSVPHPLNEMIEPFGKNDSCITISNALKWLWPECTESSHTEPIYSLFITNPGSGTRRKIEKALRSVADSSCWKNPDSTRWMKNEGFNLKTIELMGKQGAWVAIGSKMRDIDDINDIKGYAKENPIYVLNLVYDNKKPITRQLYLYGRLSSGQLQAKEIDKNIKSDIKAYKIDSEICKFLNDLFQKLESISSLDSDAKEFIKSQKTDFLHLNSEKREKGYIIEEMGVSKDKDWVYRHK